MEADMQQATGQAQQTRKRSVLVAGLGAAFVATLLTVAMAPSNPPPAAMPVAQAAAPTAAPATAPVTQAAPAPENSCQKVPLVWLVSSAGPNGGTVRLHEGSYVSPPFKLTSQPQAVVFPGLRRDVAFEEPIYVEGDAASIVMENLTHNFRATYPMNNGWATVTTTWVPMTTCQIGTATIPVADPQ
jgi:hypothetical protein